MTRQTQMLGWGAITIATLAIITAGILIASRIINAAEQIADEISDAETRTVSLRNEGMRGHRENTVGGTEQNGGPAGTLNSHDIAHRSEGYSA